MKRCFDILASLFGLVLLSPLFLIIAIMIRRRMGAPIIFRQNRMGRHGVPFTLFKFRTMILNHKGTSISVKGEERITPLGSRLRRHKLDELPELYNVLKGDMSFVGPRPDLPKYYNYLKENEKLILELRPGITGPASLKYVREEEILAIVEDPEKYNDEVIWPDKVKINLLYYHERSLIKDIQIILQTIFGKK